MGPYELVALIGAGGMGQVYRARDRRLGRDVAIKVLPEAWASDPNRLARFEREARVVGSLNHPNVLAVYDLGVDCGLPYLVTELLEGETLRTRLQGGALTSRRTLEYSIQLARGLAAAHANGIVHRDLKPENIFVTRSGLIRILDFGLAKGTPSSDQVLPPGDTTLTCPGTLVGTADYMSPEQVLGDAADTRSDIFSFGTVLYEMLTGHTPFRRETVAETLTAILRHDPPALSAVERVMPPALERVVRRCLEKDPSLRFHSAADLTFALEAISDASSELGAPPRPLPAALRLGRRDALLAGAGAITGGLLVAGLTAGWRGGGAEQVHSLRYLTHSGHDSSPAISPDRRTVAFTSDRDGRRRIWLKHLSDGAEAALTEGPDDHARFSPDGSMILFVRGQGGRTALLRVSLVAGTPRKLLSDVSYADWSPDGRAIAFVRFNGGLSPLTVLGVIDSEGGGEREIARIPGDPLMHPRWSANGESIVLSPVTVQAGTQPTLVVSSTKTGETQKIPVGARGFGVSGVAWNGNGSELIFSLAESAVGFLGTAGSAVNVMLHNLKNGRSRPLFWSPQGAQLMEIVGGGRILFDTSSPRVSLREHVRQGNRFVFSRWLTRGNGHDRQPVFSPDGQWVMFSSDRSGHLDLWQLSITTGAVHRVTGSTADNWDPVFTAGGGKVLFSSNRTGHFEVWSADEDGGAMLQVTHDGVDAENPTATPDGQWIVYASGNPEKLGLWKIRSDGTQARRLTSGGLVGWPEVSPDGRYVAYATDLRPTSATVRVVRIEDGEPAGWEVRLPIHNPNLAASIGRLRWLGDGRSIAVLGQNDQGVPGIFVQEFAPGRQPALPPQPLAGFDPDIATESFGLSPDGARLVTAGWEQTFSLVMADGVRGVRDR